VRRASVRAGVAIVLTAALAMAVVGCRAVLGIDPLELVDAGPDSPSPEASPDKDASGGRDTSVDAPTPDSAGPPDANEYAACVAQGTMCRPCCHMTYQASNMELTNDVLTNGCVCGPTGQCSTECASALCLMPPQNSSMTCSVCYDMAILQPTSQECMQGVQTCRNSATCRDVIDCLMACP
jgi:hypothetical protein